MHRSRTSGSGSGRAVGSRCPTSWPVLDRRRRQRSGTPRRRRPRRSGRSECMGVHGVECAVVVIHELDAPVRALWRNAALGRPHVVIAQFDQPVGTRLPRDRGKCRRDVCQPIGGANSSCKVAEGNSTLWPTSTVSRTAYASTEVIKHRGEVGTPLLFKSRESFARVLGDYQVRRGLYLKLDALWRDPRGAQSFHQR